MEPGEEKKNWERNPYFYIYQGETSPANSAGNLSTLAVFFVVSKKIPTTHQSWFLDVF